MSETPRAVCVFEDDRFSDFFPITWFRAVFELRCGLHTMAERIFAAFPSADRFLQCRADQAALVAERYPDCKVNAAPPGDCLYINGAVIPDAKFLEIVRKDPATVFTHRGVTVAFRNGLGTAKKEIECTRVEYLWNLLHRNGEQIRIDFRASERPEWPDVVHVVRPENVSVGQRVVFKPGVVLDAENGPIRIDDGVTILANSVIEGPCHIGSGTLIKALAKIYGSTSIGPRCKVGGEVEGSIIQGYSNKQHDGFLGHSYIGEWCNLGADTNTSDLKNNYSNVKVRLNGRDLDTGSLFVGLLMGDHSKSGINTMFNTGTICGPGCNVFGGGFPSKDIPAFSWVDGGTISEYRLDKALEVARTVMLRRKIEMTPAYEIIFRSVFEETSFQRETFPSQ